MEEREPLIPKHGGYRRLKTFQLTELIYDVDVRFCDRFIDPYSRTRDQMIQAGRSTVRNIVEGSQASGTSKKTELKLTGVARASLEELKRDFIDFLRHRGLKLWDRDDPRRAELIALRPKTADDVARWVKTVYEREQKAWEEKNRESGQGGQKSGRSGLGGRAGESGVGGTGVGARSGQREEDAPEGGAALSTPFRGSTPSTQSTMSTSSTSAGSSGASTSSTGSTSSTQSTPYIPETPSPLPEIAANAALTLIDVASALLDRQLAAQAKAFEREGGFAERLYRVRTSARKRSE